MDLLIHVGEQDGRKLSMSPTLTLESTVHLPGRTMDILSKDVAEQT